MKVFLAWTDQAGPEAERKGGDDMWRVNRLVLSLKCLCGLSKFSIDERGYPKGWLSPPIRTKMASKFAVVGVPDGDFDGLERSVEGRANGGVPGVQLDRQGPVAPGVCEVLAQSVSRLTGDCLPNKGSIVVKRHLTPASAGVYDSPCKPRYRLYGLDAARDRGTDFILAALLYSAASMLLCYPRHEG